MQYRWRIIHTHRCIVVCCGLVPVAFTCILQGLFTGTKPILWNCPSDSEATLWSGYMCHTNPLGNNCVTKQSTTNHYSDLTWALWCHKSSVTRLFIQLFIQVNDKRNIKEPHYRPFVRKKSGASAFLSQKGQYCHAHIMIACCCVHIMWDLF